ncbi:MAG: hypothetical protein H6585_10760 [Flavobacteriales bacterium]|nr:hypothetical protein [Flavobacteriales bacterium]MCB9448813.1 hypothetical protein [Flavobacteriales bacterium]
MKKLVGIMMVSGMALLAACGGQSEEEKAAQEQARLDSIAQAEQANQEAEMAAEQHRIDSLAQIAADTTKVDSTATNGTKTE